MIGARLAVAVLQVAIATRRRRAHHRMVVDLVGKSHDRAHARVAGDGLRILDVAQPLAYCLPGVRSRVVVSEGTLNDAVATTRSPRSSPTSARTCGPATTWCSRCSPRYTPPSPDSSAAPTRSTPCGCSSNCSPTTPPCAPRAPLPWPAPWSPARPAAPRPAHWPRAARPRCCGCAASAGGRTASPLAATAYLAAAAVLVVPTVALAVPWLTELHRLFIA